MEVHIALNRESSPRLVGVLLDHHPKMRDQTEFQHLVAVADFNYVRLSRNPLLGRGYVPSHLYSDKWVDYVDGAIPAIN